MSVGAGCAHAAAIVNNGRLQTLVALCRCFQSLQLWDLKGRLHNLHLHWSGLDVLYNNWRSSCRFGLAPQRASISLPKYVHACSYLSRAHVWTARPPAFALSFCLSLMTFMT